jgi:hypothetical protein
VGAATVLPARIPCALIVAEVLELASQREAKGRRGGREVASVQKRAAHLHLDYQRHTRGPTQRDRAATNKNWMASLPRPPWYSERHRRDVPRAPASASTAPASTARVLRAPPPGRARGYPWRIRKEPLPYGATLLSRASAQPAAPRPASRWVWSSPTARSESGGGRPETLRAELGGRPNQWCSATCLFLKRFLYVFSTLHLSPFFIRQ